MEDSKIAGRRVKPPHPPPAPIAGPFYEAWQAAKRSVFLVPILFAALFLALLGVAAALPKYPRSFVEYPIAPATLAHFRAGAASHAAWLAFPADAADEFLNWGCKPSARARRRSQLDLAVTDASSDEAVVMILDHFLDGDSTTALCDRLTLRRQPEGWFPLRHQAAWQGRGRIGWTTQPTR